MRVEERPGPTVPGSSAHTASSGSVPEQMEPVMNMKSVLWTAAIALAVYVAVEHSKGKISLPNIKP